MGNSPVSGMDVDDVAKQRQFQTEAQPPECGTGFRHRMRQDADGLSSASSLRHLAEEQLQRVREIRRNMDAVQKLKLADDGDNIHVSRSSSSSSTFEQKTLGDLQNHFHEMICVSETTAVMQNDLRELRGELDSSLERLRAEHSRVFTQGREILRRLSSVEKLFPPNMYNTEAQMLAETTMSQVVEHDGMPRMHFMREAKELWTKFEKLSNDLYSSQSESGTLQAVPPFDSWVHAEGKGSGSELSSSDKMLASELSCNSGLPCSSDMATPGAKDDRLQWSFARLEAIEAQSLALPDRLSALETQIVGLDADLGRRIRDLESTFKDEICGALASMSGEISILAESMASVQNGRSEVRARLGTLAESIATGLVNSSDDIVLNAFQSEEDSQELSVQEEEAEYEEEVVVTLPSREKQKEKRENKEEELTKLAEFFVAGDVVDVLDSGAGDCAGGSIFADSPVGSASIDSPTVAIHSMIVVDDAEEILSRSSTPEFLQHHPSTNLMLNRTKPGVLAAESHCSSAPVSPNLLSHVRNPRLAASRVHTGSVAATDDRPSGSARIAPTDDRLSSSARTAPTEDRLSSSARTAPAVSSTTEPRLSRRVLWHSLPSGLSVGTTMHRNTLPISAAQTPHAPWNPNLEPHQSPRLTSAPSPASVPSTAVPTAVPTPVPAAVPSIIPAAPAATVLALVPQGSPLQTPRQVRHCASNQPVWIPGSAASAPACRSGSVPRVSLAQGMVAAR